MISLGPAGIGSKGIRLEEINKEGLNAAEVAYTYGVRTNKEDAIEQGKRAKKLGIRLSVHAPYYVNLNSSDKKKLEASINRILQCCDRGNDLGADYIVFHPGYYGKDKVSDAYVRIADSISKIIKVVKENNWKVKLAPEMMGKINVFGSADEVLRLSKELGCDYCVDFAHIFARNLGKIDYDEVFNKIRNNHIHAHFSGIEYTDKGEKNHNITTEKIITELGEALKRNNIKDITIINESPDDLNDSVKTKKVFEKIGL